MLATLTAGLLLASNPMSTEITVYNQGFGLVKEKRSLSLTTGRQTVAIRDVAAMIEPTSVSIRSLMKQGAFRVLEQNYQYDLISPIAILNKSVGQTVRFVRTIGTQRETLTGTLISAPTSVVSAGGDGNQMTFNGLVIRTEDGRIVLNPTGEIEVLKVPEGLISVPTLLWDLEADAAGAQEVALSYITNGIKWSADYVFTIDGQGKGDLQGWVTLDNQSGATYTDAKLKLLAGDVNRPQPPGLAPAGAVREMMMKDARSGFQEESLFEYHLYTLQRPATIRNRETKQLSLLEGLGVSVEKRLTVDAMAAFGQYLPNEGEVGTGDIKPLVTLSFVNNEASKLGMPLPKGRFRIYQRDASGSVQLLGEDNIDHTPKDERVTLNVGRSFDVRATRRRVNFTRINQRSVEETLEIEVRNRKNVPETVYVLERAWGDWRVFEKSQDFAKLDANSFQFTVKLAANETKKVTYKIQTKW